MADKKPFAGLSQEETNAAILHALNAILDRMPRVDANKRMITNASEIAAAMPSVAVSGSLTAVTTVSAVTALNQLGVAPTNAMPLHMANAGANFLYDRIAFS